MNKTYIDLVTFETNSGNFYIYDNSSNIVIPITKEEKTEIENNKLSSRLLKRVEKYRLLQKKPVNNISDGNVEKYINENGTNQLILIVTESCNFRCKYCAYSGHYELNRVHSSNHMSEEIALKAIDFYIKNTQEAILKNPNLSPVIGFYGGEPLIQWNLIKNSVNYIKENHKDFYDISTFTISTNGLLLNEDNINFMLDNKFHIAISLDGPKDEHDRNRVTVNDEVTFDTVTENIKLTNKLFNEKVSVDEKVMPYSILVTYDLFADICKIEEFFKENPYLGDFIGKISGVNDTNTTYYDNLKEETIKYSESKLRRNYVKQLQNKDVSKFMKMFYNTEFAKYLDIKAYELNSLMGTCFPGQKIAVDYKGDFHMCERVCNKYPIGNVYEGFNYKKQQEYLDNILKERAEKCADCNVSNLCKLCFAQIETDGGKFNIDKETCEEMRANIINSLSLTYSIAEEFPNDITN